MSINPAIAQCTRWDRGERSSLYPKVPSLNSIELTYSQCSCHKSACPGRTFPYESDNYEFCATTGTAAPHAFTLVFPSRASATITSGTVSSPSMSSSGSVLASRSSPSKSSSGSALATASHNSAGAVLAMPLGMFLVIAIVAEVAFF